MLIVVVCCETRRIFWDFSAELRPSNGCKAGICRICPVRNRLYAPPRARSRNVLSEKPAVPSLQIYDRGLVTRAGGTAAPMGSTGSVHGQEGTMRLAP